MRVLVTGGAGFIGFHLIKALRRHIDPQDIVAMDNYNSYYDPALKEARATILENEYGVTVRNGDITDQEFLGGLFQESIDTVVHLAAQAGVRYSIEQPMEYVSANQVGFMTVLEASRIAGIRHFIYASSSSVYGNGSEVPFRESEPFHDMESLYAATKASNEMTAEVYAKIYGMKLTGLRFFTVYGSWGRPDMAYFSFADAIMNGDTIKVFNQGKLKRDFTHVSDIVKGIDQIVSKGPHVSERGTASVYNIGRGHPIPLLEFISVIEEVLGKKARKEFVGMQAGDVYETWADVSRLSADYGYSPECDLNEGILEFAQWYREWHER